MAMNRAVIKAIASYFPKTVLTNQQLGSEFSDLTAEKIFDKTGVSSRHIAAANMSAVTKAVGIVVSESSVVRLFCHGQLVGEIIPELWMMDHSPHLRGTVKREQVGELTVLTPGPRQPSSAK